MSTMHWQKADAGAPKEAPATARCGGLWIDQTGYQVCSMALNL
jgi:hypothetical protein